MRALVISTFLILSGIISSAQSTDSPEVDFSDLATKDEWRIAIGMDDYAIYYNEAHITERAGSIKQAWFKKLYKPKPKQRRAEDKTLEQFNCNSRQYSLITQITYDRRGKVIDSVDISYPRWRPIVPDSVGEILFGIICEGKPSLADMRDTLRDSTFRLGQMYEKDKDFGKALEFYESALKYAPDDEEIKAAIVNVRQKIRTQRKP